MVRPRLPLPSLLCLFGALLLLSPELLMPGGLSAGPGSSGVLQKALAFAVEKYNQDRDDRANYFKMFHVLKTQLQPDSVGRLVYDLMVDMVETTCTKTAGEREKYQKIQQCKQLPGNPQKLKCYFKVTSSSPPQEMNLAITVCT